MVRQWRVITHPGRWMEARVMRTMFRSLADFPVSLPVAQTAMPLCAEWKAKLAMLILMQTSAGHIQTTFAREIILIGRTQTRNMWNESLYSSAILKFC